MTVTAGSAAMGSVEMRSMMLPLTSTLDGAESEEPLPSKMRTFWNNVALTSAGGLLCGWTADASPRAISETAATTNHLDTEFMQAPHAREFRYRVLSKIPASAVAFNGPVASSASLPGVDFVADAATTEDARPGL